MKNTYVAVLLICVIILNCVWRGHKNRRREGFKLDDLNPVKLVDKGLGKIIDSILGGIPFLKDIKKKVKKKKGLVDKIKTTFFELFISLLTIIFMPIAAISCLVLAYYLFLFMMSNIPLLFQPNSMLKYIC
jgi:hypothetical protein|tara:strand:- start:225 stop:617 length:393 start_codon:yes stop_codon:yes gene_type:complete